MHHDLVRNSNSELPIRSSEVMNFLYLGDMDDRPLGIRFLVSIATEKCIALIRN